MKFSFRRLVVGRALVEGVRGSLADRNRPAAAAGLGLHFIPGHLGRWRGLGFGDLAPLPPRNGAFARPHRSPRMPTAGTRSARGR